MIYALLALVMGATAIALLYCFWQQPQSSPAKKLGVSFAWLLIVLTIPFYSVVHGVIFGVCYAAIALSLQVWLWLWWRREVRPSKPEPSLDRQPLALAAGWRALPRQLLLVIMVLPLSGVAALQLTTLLTDNLPWQKVNIIALGVYLMPVLWALFAFWSTAASRRWQPLSALLLICALGTWHIY